MFAGLAAVLVPAGSVAAATPTPGRWNGPLSIEPRHVPIQPAGAHPARTLPRRSLRGHPHTGSGSSSGGTQIAPSKTAGRAAALPAPSTPTGTTAEEVGHFTTDTLAGQVSALGGDQDLAPPDNGLGVGAVDVVEFVNSSGWIYTKVGNPLVHFDLNGFFQVPIGQYFTDPRVVYDPASQRWFASGLSFNPSTEATIVHLAVSQFSDPTLAWNLYSQPNPSPRSADQPRLGVSTQSVLLTWDDFAANNAGYIGEEADLLSKSDLVAGAASPAGYTLAPDPSVYALVPASLNTTSDEIFAVYNDADPTSLEQTKDRPTLGFFNFNSSGYAFTFLAVPGTTAPPSAQQPSSFSRIDTGDDRIQDVAYQNRNVWVAADNMCAPAGDTQPRSCLQLWELNWSATASVSVVQNLLAGRTGKYVYYPGVAYDSAGDLIAVFSESSDAQYPSLEAAGQLAGGGPLTPDVEVKAGAGPFSGGCTGTVCRWGDYSAAAQDPSDPSDVWGAGEYQASASDVHDWGTAVSRLTFTAPTVASVSASTPRVGQSVVLTGTDFVPGDTSVWFGSTPASAVTVQSADQLTATTPSISCSATQPLDVTATTPDGTSATSLADRLTWSGPGVSGVTGSAPNVSISGCGFTGATAVTFGGVAAKSFTVNTSTSITADPPAGTGVVDVVVTVGGATSATSPADQFSYGTVTPAVTSISPADGPLAGGTAVTITGTGFAASGLAVNFGASAAAAVTVNSATSLTATSPSHGPGSVDVTVTTSGGTSATSSNDVFTYRPVVTGVSPDSGSTIGGQRVTITGSGFTGTASVGGATSFTVNSDTSITAMVAAIPAQFVGDLHHLQVVNGGVSNDLTDSDLYHYRLYYYFTWYDHISSPGFANDNIHIVNPSTQATGSVAATVEVNIPGQPGCDYKLFSIAAQAEQIFGCPTGFGGPATVISDVPVLASQRVQYYGSFNEVPAQADVTASDHRQFAWFDRVSSPGFQNDNIHVLNPGGTSANVTVSIPGCSPQGVVIAGFGERYFTCANGFGGPVLVDSDQPVLSSQRVQFYQSFNEEWGLDPAFAATGAAFTWFDKVSSPGFLNDNIHVWNPGGSSANVSMNIPGCSGQNQTIDAGAERFFTCANGFGGPVTVTSDHPVLASQRVQYYQSFNEVPGANAYGCCGTSLYLSWFDRISSPGFLSDNVHVINQLNSQTQVTVSIPGCAQQVVWVPGDAEHIFTCTSGFGGPVTITSTGGAPLVASQRVQFYNTFNEVLAQPQPT